MAQDAAANVSLQPLAATVKRPREQQQWHLQQRKAGHPSRARPDSESCPLPDATPAMRERLFVLSHQLADPPSSTPEACAAALEYLRVLDVLASQPEQQNSRRADAPERVRNALLAACYVDGVGAAARPATTQRGNEQPSAELLGQIVPVALRCYWLWSSAEQTALKGVGTLSKTVEFAAAAASASFSMPASAAQQTFGSKRPMGASPDSHTSEQLEQLRKAEMLLPTLPPGCRAGGAETPSTLAGGSSMGPSMTADAVEEGEIEEPASAQPEHASAQPEHASAVSGSGGSVSDHSSVSRPLRAPGHLELVLDLDHTLVHAVELASASEIEAKPPPGVHTFPLRRVHPSMPGQLFETHYKLRLRDGVRAFLRETRRFCTIHVYTMGSESYAKQVISLIDPHNTFDGTILCRRDDDDELFTKSMQHLIPGEDAEAVRRRQNMIILDDREDAWDVLSRPHVLQIPQFRCWHEDASPMPPRADADATLLDMLGVLQGVSAELATGTNPSVPVALHRRRRSILAGCVLIFSGGLLRDAAHPERCVPWRMGEAFGARCEISFVEDVTHVVSPNPDTSSVKRAAQKGKHAVSLQWLLDSVARWQRQDEVRYLLASPTQPQPLHRPPAHDLPMTSAVARAEQAFGMVHRLMPSAAKADMSKMVSVAILYLAPAHRKEEARSLLRKFEEAQAAAAQQQTSDLLVKLTELVGGQEHMQELISYVTTGDRRPQ